MAGTFWIQMGIRRGIWTIYIGVDQQNTSILQKQTILSPKAIFYKPLLWKILQSFNLQSPESLRPHMKVCV